MDDQSSKVLGVMKERDFYHAKVEELKNRIKELEFDCAELQKKNEELLERCKKLASRTPEWPKGYRPTRRAVDQKKRYNERTTH